MPRITRSTFRILVFLSFCLLIAIFPKSNTGSDLQKPENENRAFLGESGSINRERVQKVLVTFDDLLVNYDTSGGCEQYNASIARDKSGDFVIAWTDFRGVNADIYAQRFGPLGIPKGSNFRVNDDVEIAGQDWSAVAINYPSGFVITWEDNREGRDIYAQRYDSSGIPIGPNFKVNDSSEDFRRASPSVAMNDSGDFVVTWTYTPYSDDIYAQRFDHAGTRLGSNFMVNDDIGPAGQSESDVTMDGSGNFVVIWRDTRDPYTNSDVYAQRYDSAGIALDSNFMVNRYIEGAWTAGPKISMNDSGYSVITWYECCSRTWAQRYDPYGNQLGVNFEVPSDLEFKDQSRPDVAIDELGNFVIPWQSIQSSPYQWDIHAQRFASTGTPIGSNLDVNDDTIVTFPRDPALAIDSSGSFAITWADNRNIISDIFVQMYDSSGITSGSNFVANDDIGSADQCFPSVTFDGLGNIIVTWLDLRYDPSYSGIRNIYFQRLNSSSSPLGTNIRVNDISGSALNGPPAVAANVSGDFVIAWQGHSTSYCDNLYAQRYNSTGTPQGSNFEVFGCPNYLYTGTGFPAIAMNQSGNFVITGRYYSHYWPLYQFLCIIAKRYNSSGDSLGSSFRIDTEAGCSLVSPPSIAMDNSGKFVITWESASSNIYAKIYDSLGTALGEAFKVNTSNGFSHQHNPAVAADTMGNFVIAWEDDVNGNLDIYAQRYDSLGVSVGSNFRVNNDAGTALQSNPAVAIDDMVYFVITWEDYRNGSLKPNIYAQRYNPDGEPIGVNYLIPNCQQTSYAAKYPSVSANETDICFAWMDNRRAKGWDIYAKKVQWDWTDVESEDEEQNINPYKLSQNYPNPFNSKTTISFSIPGSLLKSQDRIPVTLVIYNLLGQKIKTLVDEPKAPGTHQATWDGKNDQGKEIASGIYLYRLKVAGYTETKKMLFLK